MIYKTKKITTTTTTKEAKTKNQNSFFHQAKNPRNSKCKPNQKKKSPPFPAAKTKVTLFGQELQHQQRNLDCNPPPKTKKKP